MPMFRKSLLAIVFSLIASSAFAVCSQIPLSIKDASSNTVAMSSASADPASARAPAKTSAVIWKFKEAVICFI